MKHINRAIAADFEPQEILQKQWLIVFLGEKSAETEINSIIAKARTLGHKTILKPEYLPPLNVVEAIKQSYAATGDMKETINRHVHSVIGSKRERVAFLFDKDDFGSDNMLREVSQHLEGVPICSNPFADYTLTNDARGCGEHTCRNCKSDSLCNHNCIYRLTSMLLFGLDAGLHELPKKLIKAVKNSYLSGNMNTIVAQTLDEHGIAYIGKKHSKDAFSCADVSKERKIPLPQVLKCMVGSDAAGNIYVMLIPGDKTLKLRKLRRITDGIKIELVSPELLTVGAISPLQFIGRAKFFIDHTALDEEDVDISSGSLDAGIMLKTQDLVDLLDPNDLRYRIKQ